MILYFYNMATYKEVTLDDFIERYNNNEFRQDEFSIRNFLIFKDLEAFKKYAGETLFKDLNKNTPYKNKPFSLTDKEIDLSGLDMDYIENDNL